MEGKLIDQLQTDNTAVEGNLALGKLNTLQTAVEGKVGNMEDIICILHTMQTAVDAMQGKQDAVADKLASIEALLVALTHTRASVSS